MSKTGIKLVVGLGNPGPEHERDRHNVGFWFANALSGHAGASFKVEKKFFSETARGTLGGRPLLLQKPNTYMNRSGQAVQSVVSYLKIPLSDILIVHDDLDLLPGTARIKRGGGHGGHNGLRDVIHHLGRDFMRLRLGIGHPGRPEDVTDYVLKRPSGDEKRLIDDALADALAVVQQLLEGDFEDAMLKLHSRGVTPKPYRKKQKSDSTEDKA